MPLQQKEPRYLKSSGVFHCAASVAIWSKGVWPLRGEEAKNSAMKLYLPSILGSLETPSLVVLALPESDES
jgi:hypothetical protein